MNTRLLATLFVAFGLLFAACNKDDEGNTTPDPVDESVVRVTSNITADATWTADKVYVLGGRISVVDGVTLTIEPGAQLEGHCRPMETVKQIEGAAQPGEGGINLVVSDGTISR